LAGEMVAIMAVLELPPRLSFNSLLGIMGILYRERNDNDKRFLPII